MGSSKTAIIWKFFYKICSGYKMKTRRTRQICHRQFSSKGMLLKNIKESLPQTLHQKPSPIYRRLLTTDTAGNKKKKKKKKHSPYLRLLLLLLLLNTLFTQWICLSHVYLFVLFARTTTLLSLNQPLHINGNLPFKTTTTTKKKKKKLTLMCAPP